ncbi:SRPBCC family protein [Rhodovulum sulfidophilum]|uniref:SRPBCC family protein n=1 Tax=Rhodovulum sulfidophilum TaxID=35806 RepID=A0ABS1RUA2_RHOSU|nr:SRPBCC family protein [Rhodovulum sulfidophilum]MBL3551607.1 SRPBCC family protein [Rhodovulum sulfidophilum]MBL3596489.1 SRPBCC family protein [Rhodovulum sulfidophilum]MBL3609447.1 SRPBCC family protein [Rhodovulum sulfidophilum]MCE8439415.1 SRPBCC family protein [Rhodovulum sulfidophilum]MCE8456047.1 SRPBCC family protein [Rhodovulum sulfidophilum]
MILTCQEDISAPIERVFSRLTDFTRFERAIETRGGDVTRHAGPPDTPAPGMAWTIRLHFHGAHREIEAELTDYAPPSAMCLGAASSGLGAEGRIELAALAEGLTRLSVAIDLGPKTLGGRVLMQTLKLARGKLAEEMEAGLARFARRIEAEAAG